MVDEKGSFVCQKENRPGVEVVCLFTQKGGRRKDEDDKRQIRRCLPSFPTSILAFAALVDVVGIKEDPLYERFRLTRLAHHRWNWKFASFVVRCVEKDDDIQKWEIDMEMKAGSMEYFYLFNHGRQLSFFQLEMLKFVILMYLVQ